MKPVILYASEWINRFTRGGLFGHLMRVVLQMHRSIFHNSFWTEFRKAAGIEELVFEVSSMILPLK